ncbi:hypothetical protein K435DRAFT_938677 [Dendrothele bispora CBS 962.96]|uniref:Uncharacterized protein n=1 Tax=Dendrothele bispora (strain CBS 962.96) TaxID=1314807 RepID=A0A4S8MAY5_DENBC|nr:hypothetical protein K435DRAFT_938677 [Dendrothele bispora CBS 962.96]
MATSIGKGALAHSIISVCTAFQTGINFVFGNPSLIFKVPSVKKKRIRYIPPIQQGGLQAFFRAFRRWDSSHDVVITARTVASESSLRKWVYNITETISERSIDACRFDSVVLSGANASLLVFFLLLRSSLRTRLSTIEVSSFLVLPFLRLVELA